MSCDGEAKQIEVFQEEEMLELFRQHFIDFAKTPASCSAICQASDASPFFKAVKKRLAHGMCTFDPFKDKAYKKVVACLTEFIDSRNFTSSKKEIIIKSLLKVVEAIRETVTKKIVRSGLALTGQYPIDFASAMKLCPTVKDLSKAQYETMKNSVETLANKFRQRGVLTEADMDEEGIVVRSEDTRNTRKDERVLYQQRAALMNSAECVRQYKEYQRRLLAKKASTGRVGASRRTKGSSDIDLYNNWCLTLTHHQARDEATLCEALGGKLCRRKQKAAELRAQGWTPPF
jgi:hypothetical protein